MTKKTSLLIGAVLLITCATMIYGKSLYSSSKIPVNNRAAAKHIITYSQASDYIKDFEAERARVANTIDLPIAETFNRHAIAALLNAPGAESVRIYLGKKSNGEIVLVLRPVDASGNDIKTKLLNGKNSLTTSITDDESVENGTKCPPVCP